MMSRFAELWNVCNGVSTYVGAQNVVNIVGRLLDYDAVERLSYRLNCGREIEICFRKRGSPEHRLSRYGDFNLDTIRREQLRAENQIELIARLKDGNTVNAPYILTVRSNTTETGAFKLDLTGSNHPQEVGQVVDGKWVVDRSEEDEMFLGIRRDDAGLDRIILFGSDGLNENFTLRARIEVVGWTRPVHNVGLLFNWHPHLQGDGSWLPGQWTTGLGYYYSHCKGLRIRIGVNVHTNSLGEKVGDKILGEEKLSASIYWMDRMFRKVSRGRYFVSQITLGVHYWLELSAASGAYRLTVWPANGSRPSPQISVNCGREHLAKGAAGIIAHHCVVRVFEFHIEPHSHLPLQ
jgi:hypothetical protein